LVRSASRNGDDSLQRGFRASPCSVLRFVSPYATRGKFWISHYITVVWSSGGVGGLRSLMPRAFKT